MTSLNMVNMNALFKKVYFLAGMIMAANMFIVNEVKAAYEENGETNEFNLNNNPEDGNVNLGENTVVYGTQNGSSFMDRILSLENCFNLIGGLVVSGANNYFKWWNYNPGTYRKIGCLGWRTKKFFDIVQVGINLNLGRGISWVILGAYNFIKFFTVNDEQKEGYVIPLYFSFLVANFIEDPLAFNIALIAVFLLQGFLSIPLTFHISNFSISISLDSILWKFVIGKKFFKNKQVQPGEGQEGEVLKDIEDTKA